MDAAPAVRPRTCGMCRAATAWRRRGRTVGGRGAGREGVDGRVRVVRHYARGGSGSSARAKRDESDVMKCTGKQRKLGEVSGSQEDVGRLS